MAQFVLLCNGVPIKDFERALEVKIRASEKVNFVPQAGGAHGATTQAMQSVKPNPQAEEQLNNVRFEWNNEGAEFGAEIVKALAAHKHGIEKVA